MVNKGVIFLMGPTASGKTRLAELLCERLPCDVISVDSSAVYRGLDIGSAKPDVALQARLPHRLIDIRAAHETYSAADFVTDALKEIADIRAAGRIPLLVGGTMLYFKALRDGLAKLPAADPEVRQQIDNMASEQGWPAVHAQLQELDPESAARIHPNDPQRLQRALEVYRLTGNTLTELQQRGAQGALRLEGPLLQLALQPASRELLHQRIALRFALMLEQGLLGEVRGLVSAVESGGESEAASAFPALHAASVLPALRAAGYRQVVEYLQGELSMEQLQERGVIATRQLAKRQLTWLRGWPNLVTLEATAPDYQHDLQVGSGGNCSIYSQAVQICETFLCCDPD